MIDEQRLYCVLGDRLRTLREASIGHSRRLTQADLAKLVGLERTSITNIEKGNQKVPLHVLYRMCDVFGVSTNDVLPAVADVRPSATEALFENVEFSGKQFEVPPMAASFLSKLIGEEPR